MILLIWLYVWLSNLSGRHRYPIRHCLTKCVTPEFHYIVLWTSLDWDSAFLFLPSICYLILVVGSSLFVFCWGRGRGFLSPVLMSLGGYPEVMLSPQPQACTWIIIDRASSCHRTRGKTFHFSCQLCLNFFFKTEISDRSHHGPLISQMTCRYDFRTY